MKPEKENEPYKIWTVALCLAVGAMVLFLLKSKSQAIKDMPSDGNQKKTNEEGRVMIPTPSSEPDPQPAIKRANEPKNKWYKSIEPYRFAVEVVTLAFFLWYVDLTYWQTKSSTEQLATFKQ